MLRKFCNLIQGPEQLAGKILSRRKLVQRFSSFFSPNGADSMKFLGSESKGWMNIGGVEKVCSAGVDPHLAKNAKGGAARGDLKTSTLYRQMIDKRSIVWSMNAAAEYISVLENSVAKLDQLQRQKDRIELEMSKLRQLIQAALNMIDHSPSGRLGKRLAQIEADLDRESSAYGLTEAVRAALLASGARFLTVAGVRDALKKNGFDFSSYKSNPLAAVSTTLRRLAQNNDDVEVSEIEGVNAFRIRRPLSATVNGWAVSESEEAKHE
jgi:hypothetical protein